MIEILCDYKIFNNIISKNDEENEKTIEIKELTIYDIIESDDIEDN